MSFKRLDPEDFLVSSDAITSTMWSTNLPSLSTFFTSSIQEASSTGNYYLSIFQTGSTLSNAEVQFEIAYADSLGSGSTYYNSAVPGVSPTKTIYGQYRSLILEDENSNFVFGKGNNILTGSNFWVISLRKSPIQTKFTPWIFKFNSFRIWYSNFISYG
jgi:hypothetical protein